LAKDLFERLSERDPKARFNIAEIKDHPWFKDEVLEHHILIEEL